jgi:hypothetical protein
MMQLSDLILEIERRKENESLTDLRDDILRELTQWHKSPNSIQAFALQVELLARRPEKIMEKLRFFKLKATDLDIIANALRGAEKKA